MSTLPLSQKKFDLQERTLLFAKHVRMFCAVIDKYVLNKDDLIQLMRASGSVGANYVEANESLGRKDFLMRIKICCKEAKESQYWLKI
jgi:four helix bundle protein